MSFDQRLGILLSSGTISTEVDAIVKKVVSRLAQRWGIFLTEENGSRMVTHLAMALMRIARNEKIEAMGKDAFEEFRGCKSFPQASEIVDDLVFHTGMQLPVVERDYLVANICLHLEE